MKKLLLFATALTLTLMTQAQVLISNHFDGYNGDPATVAPGWYYSWNDSSSSSRSFYTSTASCGITCPSYKFGLDSVTIISPYFTGADSVRFYFKGNGSAHDSNTFSVFGSTDSVSWTLIAGLDSISLSASTMVLPVTSYNYLKFYYNKVTAGLNVGLDDIYVYHGAFDGIEEVPHNAISIFPNPAKGEANIRLNGNVLFDATITIMNLVGREMMALHSDVLEGNYLLNIRNLNSGIYFVKIKSDRTEIVQRLIVEK